MPPAEVPSPTVSVPDGWRVVSERETTPFDAVLVSVRAHTVLLEDASLREQVSARGAPDATWRFFFASRLRVRPAPTSSRPVARLVSKRANAGFAEVLRDEGFTDVRAVESRRFTVRDETADLTRYRARVTVEEFSVAVDGYLAAWPDDATFLLAGGAYPREVESGPGELAESFAPERFRSELFEMIRATR